MINFPELRIPRLWVPNTAPYGAWGLRDTPTLMHRDKVDVAKQSIDAYNRRDVDGLFAELVTPDLEWWPAVAGAYEGGCLGTRPAAPERTPVA